jgi:hypothetical protein
VKTVATPLDTRQDPTYSVSLPDFRDWVAGYRMSTAERQLLLDQAQLIVDDFYVHLAHKKAMYGIDPSQQLRLLARRQRAMDDPTFHRELLRIFDGLRDMHTTYVLPEPYRGRVSLGFAVERYWDAEHKPHYVVSKVEPGGSALDVGMEITHWNGMPIETAVQRNAELEAGGNPAARLARGLEGLTLRNAALSPLPAEDFVYLRVDGQEGDYLVDWRVWPYADPLVPDEVAEADTPAGRHKGFSMRTEMVRRTKAGSLQSPDRPEDPNVDELPTGLRDEVKATIIKTTSGEIGHLRIYTFHTADGDVEQFLTKVGDVLALMPPDGLILDVRGNGGGYIDAAEGLLGLLSARRIQPEPVQFINSALTYQLCGRSPDLVQWRASIAESAETGELYSARFPLSDVPVAANPYPGPVILITDALAYSATDMLAAGFQDNRLGWVLGVDDNTGAGGANVWSHRLLQAVWPQGPFQPLPGNARLYVAMRRCLRIGRYDGRPVEDLGVMPDVSYRMTRDDVLAQNRDLLNRAMKLLLDLKESRRR